MLREAYAETYPVRPLLNEIERLTRELAEVQRMRNAEMYPQPTPSNHVLDYLRKRGAEMDVLQSGQRVISLETQAADEIERLTRTASQLETRDEQIARKLGAALGFKNYHINAEPMADHAISELERLTRERDEALAMRIAFDQTSVEAERDRLRALLRRVHEWTPAFPVEAGLLDEIGEALRGEALA